MHCRVRGGFTLVEMLLVVSLIVLLIAMLLPSLQASRCRAQMVKCLSQFEAIGTGLNMHVINNNRMLPGPSWYGQEPRYTTGTKTVARFLAPYMGFPKATGSYQVNTTFICPSFEAVKPNYPTNECVIMGASGPNNPANGLRVFGYPAFEGDPEYGPASIGAVKFPSRAQAVKEIDQFNNPTAGWVSHTARVPNHCWGGSTIVFRNNVFFDGHSTTAKEFLNGSAAN